LPLLSWAAVCDSLVRSTMRPRRPGVVTST
jgi:hypothetical protein